MGNKPEMKRQHHIEQESNITRSIVVDCEPLFACMMREFGNVHRMESAENPDSNRWFLSVDGRYDFDEVLIYIDEYYGETNNE